MNYNSTMWNLSYVCGNLRNLRENMPFAHPEHDPHQHRTTYFSDNFCSIHLWFFSVWENKSRDEFIKAFYIKKKTNASLFAQIARRLIPNICALIFYDFLFYFLCVRYQ